jgi:endonuclease YncB( thermonuclease family)
MRVEILLPNGKLLTHELIKEGLAWVRPDSAHDPSLNNLEELARAAGKGLWSEPNPIPPWQWKPTKSIYRN